MRSIAVLVIAAPVQWDLQHLQPLQLDWAGPQKMAILFRHAKSLEAFKDISQVVFDKTGTLTTGDFVIANINTTLDDDAF